MHPTKVRRAQVNVLMDLPNIGPSVAGDLRTLGIEAPVQLIGQDPVALYDRLCALTGTRQDPCVLDVFLSVVRFMDGEDPKPWWDYTAERKALLGSRSPIADSAAEEAHLLERIKYEWEDTRFFYSNKGKTARERWVVEAFLRARCLAFDLDEIQSEKPNSQIDVRFRLANFQVKEILDPLYLRGKVIHEQYMLTKSAISISDLTGTPTTYDIPSIEDGYRLVLSKSIELVDKYTVDRNQIDLLFYITRTRTRMIQENVIQPADFESLGWRSVSCLMGSSALVLFADEGSPNFLFG